MREKGNKERRKEDEIIQLNCKITYFEEEQNYGFLMGENST